LLQQGFTKFLQLETPAEKLGGCQLDGEILESCWLLDVSNSLVVVGSVAKLILPGGLPHGRRISDHGSNRLKSRLHKGDSARQG